jgi:metal-sulfur cluster biosynthetic enzyme
VTTPAEATIPAAKCEQCGHHARIDEITACRYCDCTRHVGARPGPHQGHDPQTPPGAEAALEYLKEEMERARLELAGASDAEVEAELARDAARRKLQLSDECPPVGVFDGVRVTVAWQKAWIDDRIVAEEREYRLKKKAREAAAKRLDVLGRQAITQASIAKSVGTGYQFTRSGERW